MNKRLNQWINNLYRYGAIDVGQRDDLKHRLNEQHEDFAAISAEISRYMRYMPAQYQARWEAAKR